MADHQISELVAQLKSNETYVRNDAIKIIIKENINDGQIITALKDVIENDPSMAVRDFARSALDMIDNGYSTFKKPEPIDKTPLIVIAVIVTIIACFLLLFELWLGTMR